MKSRNLRSLPPYSPVRRVTEELKCGCVNLRQWLRRINKLVGGAREVCVSYKL